MIQSIVKYFAGERDDDRPWGSWETKAVGDLDGVGLSYCDKVIRVKPGQILSIQKHEFREEYWAVTAGVAAVYVGPSSDNLARYEMTAGDRIHIPLGVWHRIENIGAEPMVFSERQVGIYLDESDILREPTATDKRTTNEAEMARIRSEVADLGLRWPEPYRQNPPTPGAWPKAPSGRA